MRLNKTLSILATCFLGSAFAGEILFVDLNYSKQEIQVAQKAAKEKGDTLIIIPEKGKLYDHNEFKRLVHEKSFKSLIISGHSGGDVFQGGEFLVNDTTGTKKENRVKIEDILSALDNSKSDKLESLYLIGCYTANKSKIAFWKTALPDLKFIAGFDKEAPLSAQPAAQKYLYELMKKEEAIKNSSSSQNLKLLLNGIDVLKIVNTSLYIKCQDEDYNYVPLSSKKFTQLDSSQCAELIGDFRKNYLQEVRKYLSGELEPTAASTKAGPLRKAYSLARQAEHCYDLDTQKVLPELNPDSLFHLLFNKGFNESFSRFYKTDIEQAIEDAESGLRHDAELAVAPNGSSSSYVMSGIMQFIDQRKEIEATLENPAFDQLVNQEFQQMKSDKDNLANKNPGLDDCVLWNRNCNFPPSLIRKYAALHQMQWRFTSEDKSKSPAEIIREKLKSESNRLSPSFQPSGLTTDNISIMKKMVNNPETVTRKDIIILEKTLRHNRFLTPALENFKHAIGRAYQLSPDFPFSMLS